jgi:hypothetical protein
MKVVLFQQSIKFVSYSLGLCCTKNLSNHFGFNFSSCGWLRFKVVWPFLWIVQPFWTVPPQRFLGQMSSSTGYVCRVVFRGHASPTYFWVLIYLGHSIGDKLAVLSFSTNPVESDGAI